MTLALAIVGVNALVGKYGSPAETSRGPKILGARVESITPPVPELSATTSMPAVTANATVVKVVDGDTIDARIDGESKDSRIRFLGINTPEVVDPREPVECFGKEASARMHALADGKRVRLDADPQADEIDKYGRLLRNVILEDGTDLNAKMVGDGYAYAYLSFPLNPKRKSQLKKLEQDAKMAGRGLWSPQACNGANALK